MLQDYKKLSLNIIEKFKSITKWPEAEFNESDKVQLKKLQNIREINSHSVQFSIGGEDGNLIVVPSQYILHAVVIKEFAQNVYDYLVLFDKLRSEKTPAAIFQSIEDNELEYSSLNTDEFSKIIGPKLFSDESFNLKAKNIANEKNGKYILRSSVDFFWSVIQKTMNIPANSTSFLGNIIYSLCGNPEVYDHLQKKFLSSIPGYIVKERTIKDFVHLVLSFIYNYDHFDRIKPYLEVNSEGNSASVRYGSYNLTSVFRISESLLGIPELTSGSKLRYFENPVFLHNNHFYYLSSEWTDNASERLDLMIFEKIIEELYPEFKFRKTENEYFLESISAATVNRKLDSKNIIYYGAPGTGKSFKVDQIIRGLDPGYYERVTFHPEYDNASFIGGYKPVSERNSEGKDMIRYRFVPQVFVNIYQRAWKDLDNSYYLIVEEINRGNCAEIFGEIFQILDREAEYTVSASEELTSYLVNEFGNNKEHEGIRRGLKLPPNLSILATMNTSDQSLFPMDSAFKRRWEWEYIPICYELMNDHGEKNSSYDFEIELDNDTRYRWIDFISRINNNHIKNNPSLGMDKCLGNYFITPDSENVIGLKSFIHKVIFYLWNDVFKEEDNNVFEINSSYEDFFPVRTSGLAKVKELFDRIELQPFSAASLAENEI